MENEAKKLIDSLPQNGDGLFEIEEKNGILVESIDGPNGQHRIYKMPDGSLIKAVTPSWDWSVNYYYAGHDPTDQEILEGVDIAIETANACGDDWTWHVNQVLGDLGVLAERQPDDRDMDKIALLKDGRTVWLAAPQLKGAKKYRIE